MTTPADLTDSIRSAMPLCSTLGVAATSLAPDCVELSMPWSEALCTTAGLLHGGALMALADSAGAVAAFMNLPAGASGTSTIESKTNFLGAVDSGTVTACARPLHLGSTTIVIEMELRTNERLAAKVTQTQIVLRAAASDDTAARPG
jgi:uncharacterized protein (TIGR00369 family)